ncbi:MAG: hypothetical protein JRJ51_11220 [Deltaproteobacteria bacterium]|nr:hypothetical protein [Deltaproteobacteria bacterium]
MKSAMSVPQSKIGNRKGGALFSDGYIRYLRFFRPIDPACAGLYAVERRILNLNEWMRFLWDVGGRGTFSLDTLDKQLKCKYVYGDS